MSRPSEVPGIAVAALSDPISPELVLVDPSLAAVERPREFARRVIARQVAPLGVPLFPLERSLGTPVWRTGAIGLGLLVGGLLVSMLLFSGSAAKPSAPTVVSPKAVVQLPPGTPIPPAGLPAP